jgi:hypothetical protein
MAYYSDATRVHHLSVTPGPPWSQKFKLGEIVPTSGIYYCTGCNMEYCLNAGDPFPAQNNAQHPATCKGIEWILLVQPK